MTVPFKTNLALNTVIFENPAYHSCFSLFLNLLTILITAPNFLFFLSFFFNLLLFNSYSFLFFVLFVLPVFYLFSLFFFLLHLNIYIYIYIYIFIFLFSYFFFVLFHHLSVLLFFFSPLYFSRTTLYVLCFHCWIFQMFTPKIILYTYYISEGNNTIIYIYICVCVC